MKSRTSFFNGTVLRKDITRFCPVWALYLVFLLMWTMSVFDSKTYRGVQNILDTLTSFSLLNLIYGYIVPVMILGDLFNSRLCNGIHALSPRRESWFATHCLAGLLFSFVPNVILAILITLYSATEIWFLGLVWLLIITAQYLFFFGLGVFSAMCCGNRVAATAVYSLINFGSLIVQWFAVTFYEPQLYGVQLSETIFQRLCPIAQLLSLDFDTLDTYAGYHMGYKYSYKIIMSHAGELPNCLSEWYTLICGILGLVLLVAALLLYRRRRLECAGDFMAFRWMRPIFAVVFTLTTGALFEMIGDGILNQEQVFLWPGILIGYLVAQMLLQRTVAVFKWKTFSGCAAVVGALTVSILLVMLDPLGIEKWVPNPENVQSVTIEYREDYSNQFEKTYNTANVIIAITEVHEAILEEGQITETGNSGSLRVTLSYKMKDGRTAIRNYRLRTDGAAHNKLLRFYDLPEIILGYSDWDDYLDNISSVAVQGGRFTGEQAKQLLAAVKADCEAGNFLTGRKHSTSYGTLSIITNGASVTRLVIPFTCKHTIAWLEENTSAN